MQAWLCAHLDALSSDENLGLDDAQLLFTVTMQFHHNYVLR